MWIQKVPKLPTFPIVIKKYDQVPKTTKKPKVPKSTEMLQKEEKKEQIAMKSKDLQNVDLKWILYQLSALCRQSFCEFLKISVEDFIC